MDNTTVGMWVPRSVAQTALESADYLGMRKVALTAAGLGRTSACWLADHLAGTTVAWKVAGSVALWACNLAAKSESMRAATRAGETADYSERTSVAHWAQRLAATLVD